MSEERAWDGLEPTWRTCFELAWDSFRAGSVPVGAVIADGGGTIVARGRARSMETDAPSGQLVGATIAHAELNALAQLPRGPHPGYVMFTTLEPCLMCLGALVVANIGEVRYAGGDPLWSGIEHLPDVNPFVADRWPTRVGPLADAFRLFAMLLPLLFYVEHYPTGATAASHEVVEPELLKLSRSVVASGEHEAWRRLELYEVLQLVWPRLRDIDRQRASAISQGG